MAGYPPYAPYEDEMEPPPPSIMEMITAGHGIRVRHKSKLVTKSVHKIPPQARPRGPAATDVDLDARAMCQHARCLRKYNAVLTDRMTRIAKPDRRLVIAKWREYYKILPPQAINRFRNFLDADEPFKPDQAFQYFINLRKGRKSNKALVSHYDPSNKCKKVQKEMRAMCSDRRYVWARNATVAFAKGIQQRLARPGHYDLEDEVLRLSDVVLNELCCYMRIHKPSRRSRRNKSKFIIETADKVAVWIEEILGEAENRMLMMDFDEDEDVLGRYDGYADDFMGGEGGGAGGPAYRSFRGPEQKAFKVLTEAMTQKGDQPLIQHGKFIQSNKDAARELKKAKDFTASNYSSKVANQLKKDLHDTARPTTTSDVEAAMHQVIDTCGDYLAQVAEHNKDKGPAFQHLLKAMKGKPNEQLVRKGNVSKPNSEAAKMLEQAKGLETTHDDPNLSQEVQSKLTKLVEETTPTDLKAEMADSINAASKYISQALTDEVERGPAFDIMIKELEKKPNDHFTPQNPAVATKYDAAHVLKTAPGLSSSHPNPETSKNVKNELHKAVDKATPKNLEPDMKDVIDRSGDYISEFVEDRENAKKLLINKLKAQPGKELVNLNGYSMKYGDAAAELESTPAIVPIIPIKDISDEIKPNLTKEMENATPQNLAKAMTTLTKDGADYLSQIAALKSGVAGPNYNKNFLKAVKEKQGNKGLDKYKDYNLATYPDGYGYGHETEQEKLRRLAVEKILGRPETPEERARRIEAEKRLGRPETAEEMKSRMAAEKFLGRPETAEELKSRMEAEMRLGRPETEEETRKRLAEADLKKYGSETEQQRQARKLAEEVLGRPETEDERKRRLEAEQRLGRPETPEEMRKRLAQERAAGLSVGPETEEEKSRRLAAEKILGRPETPEERARRIEAEKRLGRPETAEEMKSRMAAEKLLGRPETAEELKSRMEAEMRLGRPETEDERKRRLEAEQRLGRPETPEEMEKRLSQEREAGLSGGPETEEERSRRLAAEKILGRPETPQERANRLEAEKRLGRPETPEEMKSRMAAEMRLGRPETEEEMRKRISEMAEDGRTEAERKRRLEVEKQSGRPETAEELRQRPEAEEAQRREDERLGITPEMRKKMDEEAWAKAHDPEREAAMQILDKALRAKGREKLYDLPHSGMTLTHQIASDWLKKGPVHVEKSVKDSADTARLAEKLERKLGHLVSKVTTDHMKDVMQDVIIESARKLAEYYAAKTYKNIVEDALIGQMQKKGNDILVGVDGAGETCFFAAQRLKLPRSAVPAEPRSDVAYKIGKELDNIARFCPLPRNLIAVMKEFVKNASDYLSHQVTKPNPQIEAYIRLLEQMDAAGADMLFDGPIKMTYRDAAAYLRQLTSFEDKIKLADPDLLSCVENKLNDLTKDVVSDEFPPAVMRHVVSENAKLLASHIALMGKKTAALRVLASTMKEEGDHVLLRHGMVRKIFKDGADMLRGITADQLPVKDPEPVVCRKILVKLENLMDGQTPVEHAPYMDDVIEDVSKYLAVTLLQPQRVKVCKCMKNVFVQCELWCEEILRRLSKPCCVCSRIVSAAELQDLVEPGMRARVVPGTSSAVAPGVEIFVKPCPAIASRHAQPTCWCQTKRPPCPAVTASCRSTVSYVVYETERDTPTRLPRSDSFEELNPITYRMGKYPGPATSNSIYTVETGPSHKTLIRDIFNQLSTANQHNVKDNANTTVTDTCNRKARERVRPKPSIITNKKNRKEMKITNTGNSNIQTTSIVESVEHKEVDVASQTARNIAESDSNSRLTTQERIYSNTPITTEDMPDWHTLLVSLMWNVQAWQGWLQDNINLGINYVYTTDICDAGKADDKGKYNSWTRFQRRVMSEALQWREYNIFSRQLTLRLLMRYRDKEILSPGRQTNKTKLYDECQREMLNVVRMFNKWTQWLMSVVKEADEAKLPAFSTCSVQQLRWNHYKMKVKANLADWEEYTMHLKVAWEEKYCMLISEWIPSWKVPGPVWVVSACGAVPSGAVPAGMHDNEIIWLARTTHKSEVYPAAVRPSKHTCLVYAEGTTYYYVKYQVMCNATVKWVPTRSDIVNTRAVRVTSGVRVGRVRYRGSHLVGAVRAPAMRCHVVILGRAFAFNCYDLLVLADDEDKTSKIP